QRSVANCDITTFDCVQRRRQSATAGHESFRIGIETNAMRPRLQINLFRPTAAQSIVETIRDAINLPLRAARCGLRHQAVPARVARAMHVEKRDAISLTKFSAMNVAHTSANFAQASDRYM